MRDDCIGAIGSSELPWPKKLTYITGPVWRSGVGVPTELISSAKEVVPLADIPKFLLDEPNA